MYVSKIRSEQIQLKNKDVVNTKHDRQHTLDLHVAFENIFEGHFYHERNFITFLYCRDEKVVHYFSVLVIV